LYFLGIATALLGCAHNTPVAKSELPASQWVELANVKGSMGPFTVDIPAYFGDGSRLPLKVGGREINFLLATNNRLVAHCDIGSGAYVHTFALYNKMKQGQWRITKYFAAPSMSVFEVDLARKEIIVKPPKGAGPIVLALIE
jgi:hypothetical protein